MNNQIQIGDRLVGEGQPLFVIAECGVTCNYDFGVTRQLVDAVRDARADAIKLIFWFPDEIMSDKTILYEYETVDGLRSENMFEMLNKLRFSLDEWIQVKRYADERGIILFATVNSPSGIEYAEALGLPAYKLSSWDYTYFPLLRRIAAFGKPVILDTGPVGILEVAKFLALMREAGNDQSILVHCTHSDNVGDWNMRSLPYMRSAFNTPVGYSAKGRELDTDLIGVALGAVLLEKRLTISRRLPGHHHVLSLEPGEFKEYVRRVRDAQAALGSYELRPSPADLAERTRWFRHLVAKRDLLKGTRLTLDMLDGKRPEAGISPEYIDFFIGRTLKRDMACNEALSWDDV